MNRTHFMLLLVTTISPLTVLQAADSTASAGFAYEIAQEDLRHDDEVSLADTAGSHESDTEEQRAGSVHSVQPAMTIADDDVYAEPEEIEKTIVSKDDSSDVKKLKAIIRRFEDEYCILRMQSIDAFIAYCYSGKTDSDLLTVALRTKSSCDRLLYIIARRKTALSELHTAHDHCSVM